jgi:hypothetical protein
MRIVICAALISVACGNKPAEPPPKKSEDGFELVSPGAEPRVQLRYRPVVGAVSAMAMSMNFDLETGGTKNQMPTLVLDLELAVVSVAPDGSASIRTTIKRASARDRVAGSALSAATMNQALALVDNIKMTSTLSPRGHQKDSKVENPKQSIAPQLMQQIAMMTQGLEQLAMPMPEPAVGVGAKWRATRPLAQNGVDMTSTTTIEITAIEGDKVSFASTTNLTGPDQTLKEAGQSVKLEKVGGSGGGTGSVDLARLAMTGDLEAEFKATATSDGKTGPLGFAMTIQVKPAP